MGEKLPLHEQFKKLNVKASTSEQGQENEAPDNPQQTPERGGGTKNNATRPRKRLEFSSQIEENIVSTTNDEENEEGNFFQDHPWQDTHPNPGLSMDDTIGVSEKYPPPKEWLDDGESEVNLSRIYHDLPKFVSQMRGKSEYEMLKEYMNAKNEEDKKSKRTPHMKEIEDDEEPRDKPSSARDQSFKAYSLDPTKRENQQETNLRHLDCEYMLKMYLPENRKIWFKHEDTPSGLIRTINSDKKDKRWIFTPSFRRSEIALLDWPEDKIVTVESTIQILVVRPCEFEKYVERCGHTFPIISLANDEIGAGYARLWIQKIALRLKLDFIWMIDDSVECFYEYHPDKKIEEYAKYRRRQFGLVFEHIEKFVKPPGNIAVMSPRRTPPGRDTDSPFTCKPPFIAVYLNLKALKEKEVFYRPELKVLEDMVFGYECYKNGLNVFRDNRFRVQDHFWKDTGAMSSSVRPPHKSDAGCQRKRASTL